MWTFSLAQCVHKKVKQVKLLWTFSLTQSPFQSKELRRLLCIFWFWCQLLVSVFEGRRRFWQGWGRAGWCKLSVIKLFIIFVIKLFIIFFDALVTFSDFAFKFCCFFFSFLFSPLLPGTTSITNKKNRTAMCYSLYATFRQSLLRTGGIITNWQLWLIKLCKLVLFYC